MIRVGVIGIGRHGERHVKAYRELEGRRSPLQLVGLYDSDHKKAHHAGAAFNVPVFDNFEGMLKSIDAVSVAVPTSHHRDIVLQAFRQGVHVLVEKPLSSTLEEGAEMVDTARDTGCVFMVGHVERFNGALRILKEKSFQLRPRFVETHRLSSFQPRGTDVSVVFDLMIHDIDVVLSLMSSGESNWEPEDIRAAGVAVVSHGPDIANARLEFADGCVANLTASRLSVQRLRKVRIFQKNTYISMDMDAQETDVYQLEGFIENPEKLAGNLYAGRLPKIHHEHLTSDKRPTLEVELDAFVGSIVRGEKPPVTGEDGLRALKVATRILGEIQRSMGE